MPGPRTCAPRRCSVSSGAGSLVGSRDGDRATGLWVDARVLAADGAGPEARVGAALHVRLGASDPPHLRVRRARQREAVAIGVRLNVGRVSCRIAATKALIAGLHEDVPALLRVAARPTAPVLTRAMRAAEHYE